MAKFKITHKKNVTNYKIKGDYHKITISLVEIAENDYLFAGILEQAYECFKARSTRITKETE